jgi:hypothetical protein
MAISPGVYSKIIDLSTYVQAIPSTSVFLAILSKKGRDNQLIRVSSRSDFISEFGEPNIADFTKSYGQGPYIAYNLLGETGALSIIRALPTDAKYSNIRIDALDSDTTTSLAISYIDNATTLAAIEAAMVQDGTTYPICALRPIGRGDYYNGISIKLTEHSNPMYDGVYILDIYEKQSDGTEVIIESFEVSFDPTAVDLAGSSIYINEILETYSGVLRAVSGTDGYNLCTRVYDKEIGEVSIVETASSASITDNQQDFSDWQTSPESGQANYVVIAKDQRGNVLWGWLGSASGSTNSICNVFNGKNLSTATQSWIGNTSNFDADGSITYRIMKSYVNIATSLSDVTPLQKGSLGSLISEGSFDTEEATNVLVKAYTGLLKNPTQTASVDDSILDTETYYFNVIFDAGYPDDVKNAINTLVTTRRDSISILDNGDNTTVSAELTARSTHNWNTYFSSIWCNYNKVYDEFTGQDVWSSPLFHVSYLLPRNDNVRELWSGFVGFPGGVLEGVKETRYNPKLADRDDMYLKQLNPIVQFAQGYVFWGQLTSQSKPSALQDVNVVRMILYVKRALEQYCRYFIFDLNNQSTWDRVGSDIRLFLEDVKNRQGLYSYDVEVSATEYERKTKQFHVNVMLEPMKLVEKINLNFFIL